MPIKRIFDIIPPQEAEKLPFPAKLEPKPKSKHEEKPVKKPRSPFKKIPIFIGAGIILILGLTYVLIEPKAEIAIWPKTEVVEFKTSAQIAGKIVKAQYTASQEFPSTGTKLKSAKAHGTIKVYNTYSTSAQSLVAATRFVSDSGKLFRTPAKVVIPGGHYEGGKLIPGTVDITVEADQPGEEYNIGPATFSIPGFAGTAKYTAFYAKSSTPMVGGMKTEASEVTQEDLDKAQEILTAKALAESKINLENSMNPEDDILTKEALTAEVIDVFPLAEKGQEVENFIFQVKAEAKALIFKKSDLIAFSQNYTRTQIPSAKELQGSSLEVGYLVQTVSIEESKITLDLSISAKIYSVIDEDSLKETIKNKKPAEIKELLKNVPEIDKAQVKFWPFWVIKSPQNRERIEIKLVID